MVKGNEKKIQSYNKYSRDEPLLHPDHLIKLMDCFKDSKTEFATVAQELNSYKNLPKDKVFLVKDQLDFALYF